MDALIEAFRRDFSDLVDADRLAFVVVRLVVAAVLGAVLGLDRQIQGKAAGLRTHMLVTISSAFMVLIPYQAGFDDQAMSRVLQGLITGVGFLGGGAILKLLDHQEIRGLTTAASLWLSAGIGIAAGFGRLGSALLVTLFALGILASLESLERRVPRRASATELLAKSECSPDKSE